MPRKLTPLSPIAKRYSDLVATLPAESAAVVAGMILSDAFLDDLGEDAAEQYLQVLSKRYAENLHPQLLSEFVSKRAEGADVESIAAIAQALSQISKADFGFNPQEPRDAHGRWAKGSQSRAAFDAVHAVTGDKSFAAHIARRMNPNAPTIRPGDMHARPEEESSETAYRRLRAGADILNATGGTFLPTPVALALHGASYVGQYGPEAQKVFGPAIERTKYRYRGTERKLDPALATAVAHDRRSVTAADAAKNKQLTATVADARAALKAEEARPERLTADFKHEIARVRAVREMKLNRTKDDEGNDIPPPTAAQARQIHADAQAAAGKIEAHYKRLREASRPRIAAARTQLAEAEKAAKAGAGIDQSARNKARDKMVYPDVNAKGEAQFSATIGYFKDQLPKKNLSVLQRMSGHIPPSQGVIINAKGDIGGQMVGSGDDWYLPFNLANLGQLQGGEYVRTRAAGGLSTEDVYTGLMSGARAMTVVSRNGVYTMQFDDHLRGSRRYSAAAREMTDRYGQLLDAVKAGKVRPEIPQSRLEEIYNQAEERGLDPKALIDREYANPTPSRDQQKEWARDYLEKVAASHRTADGGEHDVNDLIEQQILPERVAYEQDTYRQTGLTPPPVAELREQERAKLQHQLVADPIGMAIDVDAAGASRYLKGRTIQYAEDAKPMQLDGPGYGHAMEALQEQFPYFIDKVKYTPWHDAPLTGSKREFDDGYIKPRFVRPAKAQAGYFDSSITGEGKRGADTIHYQNYGVMRSKGHYKPEEAPQQHVRTAPSEPQPAAQPQAAAQARADHPDRANTIRALLKTYVTRDTFGPNAKVYGPNFAEPTSLANTPIEDHRKDGWMNDPRIGMHYLHLTPERIDSLSAADLEGYLKFAEITNHQYNLFEATPEQTALEAELERQLHTTTPTPPAAPAPPPAPPKDPQGGQSAGPAARYSHRSTMFRPITADEARAWSSGQSPQ